jgi:hypothetical protein
MPAVMGLATLAVAIGKIKEEDLLAKRFYNSYARNNNDQTQKYFYTYRISTAVILQRLKDNPEKRPPT